MLCASLAALCFMYILPVAAADVTNRYIQVGSAEPSQSNVDYTIGFTPATASNLGSIRFQFCDNSPLTNVACSLSNGLDITSAGFSAQSGNTGFSSIPSASPATDLLLTRASSAAALVTSSYKFDTITNPTPTNSTTFVRISLYSSIDGTGTPFDIGSVAFSTSQNFSVGAYVPPYLTFCTGQTVAIDCSTTTGSLVGFGELSTTTTRFITSQFSAATNDPTGYNTFVSGQTMTSGNNVINQLTSQTPSIVGQTQFGLNLRQNSAPAVGANPQGVGYGIPAAAYNSVNQFRFNSGDLVASSPNSTEFTRFTASYIVNITEDQNPGVYSTTLVYTAVASF